MKSNYEEYTAFILLLIVILVAGLNYIAMLIWNNVIVSLFGLPTITFWQMFGLAFVARWLFPSVSVKKD